MSIRGDITQKLAERLRDKENTVTDIARLCEVSRQTVHSWLNGNPASNPLLSKLVSLLEPEEIEDEIRQTLDLLLDEET